MKTEGAPRHAARGLMAGMFSATMATMIGLPRRLLRGRSESRCIRNSNRPKATVRAVLKQKGHPAGLCTDGVNDGPALMEDVGIFVARRRQCPSIVLTADRLDSVATELTIAQKRHAPHSSVAVAKAATNAKIATCSIAIFQAMVVSALGLFS